jgi:DNA repair exonuclease SbcCD ATPase subunit
MDMSCERYEYDEEMERRFIEEAEKLEPKVREMIKEAMDEVKEVETEMWKKAKFVASYAGGIADYFYDTAQCKMFRGPIGKVLPALIKYGDVGISEAEGRIVRREKVIAKLKRRIDETMQELKDIERKLKRRPSKLLEERKRIFESDLQAYKKALEEVEKGVTIPIERRKVEEADEFTRLVQIFCRHEYVVNGRCVTCGKVIGK